MESMTAERLAPATYVTDPTPATDASGQSPRCEFKIYPHPDEVIFCDLPAIAVLAAPCCGQTTSICVECLGKGGLLGEWLCLGCSQRTDCKWTPIEFSIRWL